MPLGEIFAPLFVARRLNLEVWLWCTGTPEGSGRSDPEEFRELLFEVPWWGHVHIDMLIPFAHPRRNI